MNQCNRTGCQNLRVRDWHRMAEILAWRSHRRGLRELPGRSHQRRPGTSKALGFAAPQADTPLIKKSSTSSHTHMRSAICFSSGPMAFV